MTTAVILIGIVGAVVWLMRRYNSVDVVIKRRLPVTIFIHADFSDSLEFLDAVQEACDWWNNVTGLNAFLPFGDTGCGHYVHFIPAGGPLDGVVVVGDVVDHIHMDPVKAASASTEQLKRTLQYELGRYLGLEEDVNFPRSVMFNGEDTSFKPELLEKDKEILEAMYRVRD